MKKEIKTDTWVWVVVQNPGPNEQFLGQHYDDQNVSFIPAFFEKEDAQQCLIHMTTNKGDKYEVQAIFFKELADDAAKHDFKIFMLNADGEILEKFAPQSRP
jgi:glutathione peroxidase-family protein